MGKAKSLITSALVVSGATALSPVDVGATELEPNLFADEDLTMMIEQELVEKALRNYTNPFNRIEAEMNQDHAEEISYTITEGDTLSEIAQEHGVTVSEIVHQNDISNVHRISIGQELKIRISKKNYVIKFGDKAEQIAEEHGISLDELFDSNSLLKYASGNLYPGVQIQVPTAAPEIPANVPTRDQRHKINTVAIASRSEEATLQAGSFSWPVSGTITSRFGMRWGKQHNGIDIANGQKKEASIKAAGAGVVKEAGYNSGGYGNLIIIDHGNGIETYYAHLSSISVKDGQEVRRGEVLGKMGQTGRATGYHLHFEIRKDEKPLNPVKFLE